MFMKFASELKSKIRITHNFPTIKKSYSCIYSTRTMDGPSNAMKLERFDDGAYFHHWPFSLACMRRRVSGISEPLPL
jgi:hypothetical protein